ncbi:MAG: hypothetical protein AAF348_19385 [Bacteroidota bacterium]
MRIVKSILLFLLIVMNVFCINKEDKNDKSENIKRLTKNVIDSSNMRELRKHKLGPSDSLGIDFSKGFLTGLEQDTLLLTAQFSECGEFGGRREIIKIYKNENYFNGRIILESIDCMSFTDKESKYIENKENIYRLEMQHQERVIFYMENLLKMYFLKQKTNKMESINHIYKAEISSPLEKSPYFTDKPFLISISDNSLNWNCFTDLTNYIKKTAVELE